MVWESARNLHLTTSGGNCHTEGVCNMVVLKILATSLDGDPLQGQGQENSHPAWRVHGGTVFPHQMGLAEGPALWSWDILDQGVTALSPPSLHTSQEQSLMTWITKCKGPLGQFRQFHFGRCSSFSPFLPGWGMTPILYQVSISFATSFSAFHTLYSLEIHRLFSRYF